MSKVLAIGGTGQLVAHYYLQLYLLGVISAPADLVVIDTDDIIPGIHRIKTFLELLRIVERHPEHLSDIARRRREHFVHLDQLPVRRTARLQRLDAHRRAIGINEEIVVGIGAVERRIGRRGARKAGDDQVARRKDRLGRSRCNAGKRQRSEYRQE